VGPNGVIASPASGGIQLWNNGTTTTLPAHQGEPFLGNFQAIYTDGVGAAYKLYYSPQGSGWVTVPGAHEHLGSTDLHGGFLNVQFAGGWTAWDGRFSTSTADSVTRRAPGGARQLLTSGQGGRLAALAPTGAVVYSSAGSRFGPAGTYYLAPASGAPRAVGPAGVGEGETVMWRDNRFVLIAGGAAYELSP